MSKHLHQTIAEFQGIDALPRPRRIGCLMLAEIGDVLVTTPCLQALRERYPEAEITMIVRKPLVRLVARNPFISEVIALDAGSPYGKLRFLLALWRRRFDIVFDLHTPTFNTCTDNGAVFARNSKVQRFIRSTYKVGYAAPEVTKCLTHGLVIPSDQQLAGENIVDTTLRIVGGAGVRRLRKRFDILDSERQWASAWLHDHALRAGFYIVCFFGSKQEADIWPDEHCRELCRRFLEQNPSCAVAHVGGELEEDLGSWLTQSLSASFPDRFHDLAGRTTLGQTAALIESAAAMVSTDSGPLHIADSIGAPVVCLFSSKNHPGIWAPLQPASTVLHQPVSCGPCFSSRCLQSRHSCMKDLPPSRVLAELARIQRAEAPRIVTLSEQP